MKILQLVHRFPPSVGGSQFYAYRVAQEAASLGHQVEVATTTSLTPLDTLGIASKGLILRSKHPTLPSTEAMAHLTVHRFEAQAQFYTYLFTPTLRRWLVRQIDQYAIVHSHGYTFLEPNYALTARAGRKRPALILSGHDLTQPHTNPILKQLMGWYDRTRGRQLLAGYDGFIAHTEQNKLDYLRLGVPDDRIAVIPSGVDYDQFVFDPDKKSAGLRLIFVGRLVAYKGAQYLIEALRLILAKNETATTTIVGEDQGYGDELKRLAHTHHLEDKITFAGKVDDATLVRLLQDAHYFVFPSINEGFGLVALQAIAAGCYPILAAEKSLNYLLRDIGGSPIHFQSPDQPARDIAEAVLTESWLKRSAATKRMQGLIQSQYSWAGVTRQIVAFYEQVLAHRTER